MASFETTIETSRTLRNQTSIPSNESNHFNGDQSQFGVKFFIGIILVIIVAFTLAGNCLVVLAVVNFRRLRSITNCFVVSLATADICVAILVMPTSLAYEMLSEWHFGWIFCFFWISCDVMCCTASILHLCLISLDRYWAITEPLKYKRRMSKKRTAAMITIVWFCSVMISFTPIYLGWFAHENTILYEDSKECGLSVNRVYAVISSMTSFYIPLFVMVFAYFRIFKIAREQAKEIEKLERASRSYMLEPEVNGNSGKKKYYGHRDKKAIKTLGIIMGLFVISWLPFFLMYVIFPFCESCSLPKEVESAITWLGYANSFLNPIVYAFFNKDFCTAFKKLLSCNRYRSNNNKMFVKYERQSQGGTPSNYANPTKSEQNTRRVSSETAELMLMTDNEQIINNLH